MLCVWAGVDERKRKKEEDEKMKVDTYKRHFGLVRLQTKGAVQVSRERNFCLFRFFFECLWKCFRVKKSSERCRNSFNIFPLHGASSSTMTRILHLVDLSTPFSVAFQKSLRDMEFKSIYLFFLLL